MSLSVQFFSLLSMIGTGIAAAAFMDLTGMVTSRGRLLRKYARWAEAAGWIICGCAAFYVLYMVRDGAWRMYDPLAFVSGLLLYASFIHHPVRFVGRVIYAVLIRPVYLLIRFILRLLTALLRGIYKLLQLLTAPFLLIFQTIRQRVFKNA